MQAISVLLFRYKDQGPSADIDALLDTVSDISNPTTFYLSSYDRRMMFLTETVPKNVRGNEIINKIGKSLSVYIGEATLSELTILLEFGHNLFTTNYDHTLFFTVYEAAASYNIQTKFFKKIDTICKCKKITTNWSREGVHGTIKLKENMLILNSPLKDIQELASFFSFSP